MKTGIRTDKKALTILLAFVALCFTVFGVSGIISSDAQEQWTEIAIEESYAYGAVFEVPTRKVTVGNEDVFASHTVTYPSGKTVTLDEVTLDEMGDYLVNYYAEQNGKQYKKTEKFSVKGVAYTFSGNKSSASYAHYDGFGADSDGLLVRLAYKETLEFTHVIDVNSLTSTDEIVKGFITPDTRGVYDFKKLIFTLTDIVDPSVYLRFEINRYNPDDAKGLASSFVSVGGNGQDMVGFENNGSSIKHHVNDDLGTSIQLSFTATKNKDNTWDGPAVDYSPDTKPFTLMFDAATLTAKAQNSTIATLNDPTHYEKALWNGFKSGKARLSVSASGYVSDTANFCLMNVFGITNEALSENTFTDSEKPEITINKEYETMPDVQMGYSYTIPSATAWDAIAGVCEVEANVYYNYGTDSQVTIGVADGKFTANKLGNYVIVYTAKDYFGNEAKETLLVRSLIKTPDIAVTLPEGYATEATAGIPVEFDSATASGGSGKLTEKITATLGENTVEILDGSHRFDEVGVYTVTYTVTDYIGKSTSKNYELTVTASEDPLFVDDIVLPRIFISGSKYTVPEYFAVDYSSGTAERKACKVNVTDANGTRQYETGVEITPVVANNGDKVTLEYVCDTATKTVEIPTIIARYSENTKVNMKNYLFGDSIVSSKDENGGDIRLGLAIVSEAATASAGWTFAAPLLVSEANFEIQTLANKTRYSAFEIVISDPYDANLSVKITVKPDGNKMKVVHGGEETTFDASAIANTLTFSFDGEKLKIKAGKLSHTVTLTQFANGKKFDGFNDKVYVGMNVLDAQAGDRYILNSVGGQILSYRDRDSSGPSVSLIGDHGGRYSLNSEYTVRAAISGDTFAPESACTVTVEAPNGEIVTDVDGNKLENVATDKEYVIKLTQYGMYRINYNAEEINWLGNKSSILDSVYVPDEQAPEIKFTSVGTTNATVGDVIVMPNYKVSDNISETASIKVNKFVINPNGRIIQLKGDSNSINAQVKGVYTFVVSAVDEEGNMATAKYTVEVK